MNLWYGYLVRDTTGKPVTGLKPVWLWLKKFDDNSDITPQPVITEMGFGVYKYQFDPEQNGDSCGLIDNLSAGVNPTNAIMDNFSRYNGEVLTRESSRMLIGIDPEGQVVLGPSGVDQVMVQEGVNLRQAVYPILAAAGGTLTGADKGKIIINGANAGAVAIEATTDMKGNRINTTVHFPK